MFISKTHPNAKSLFNRCIKDLNVNDAVWYTCQPLAKRIYIGFMTDFCKQAKCSKIYTAHCLRITTIQTTNDAGHEHRHIMFMTGHKYEASIRSYNRHCSVQQKKSPSATSNRHRHAWKFQTIRTNINVYIDIHSFHELSSYSFFPRAIILSNQLPPPVIDVPDLGAFKVTVKGVF
jgi:hypothetical protein